MMTTHRFLGLVPVLLLASCARDAVAPHAAGPSGRPTVASVTVAPAAYSVVVGDTVRLLATVQDSTGHLLADRAVTWITSDPSEATVSSSGLVTGVRADNAHVAISAVADGVAGSAFLAVLEGFDAADGQIMFTSAGDVYVTNPSGPGILRLTTNPAYDGGAVWSPDGTKIAFVTYRDGNAEIYVMNADGSGFTNVTNNPYDDYPARWSPDGTKILFTSWRDANMYDIYVMNADGSDLRDVTPSHSFDQDAAWSPDGTRIAFTSDRDGNGEIYVVNADGSGVRNLTNSPYWDDCPRWSPDGSRIAFSDGISILTMSADGFAPRAVVYAPNSCAVWSADGTKIAFSSDGNTDGNDDIYVINADGSGLRNVTNNPAFDADPAWSPDGTKIAFTSRRDGKDEIFVVNADGSGLRLVPSSDAYDPVWRPRRP